MELLFLPYLHYLSFLISIGCLVYILKKDYKSLLNISCSLVLLCFALWSFGMIFINNPNSSLKVANNWYNIISFGWIGFSFFSFWFATLYVNNKKLLKQKWIFISLFIIYLILVYKKWTGEFFDNHTLMIYGWAHGWKNNYWTYFFYFYYSFVMSTTLYLYFDYWKKTKYLIKKKQTKIIMISIISGLSLGSVFSVILPSLNIYFFPSIGDICSLIWVLGVVYAISKYNFLNIIPEIASKNIIATMSDALIILNEKGNITYVNKATLEMVQYREKELINKSISFLFKENSFVEKILAKAERGEVYNNENLTFKTKGYKKNVPVLFSSSLLENVDNSLAGIVCIFKNISNIKKVEKDLEIKNKEMEESIKKLEDSKIKINNAIDKIDKEKRNIDAEKNKISSIISSFNDPIIVIDRYSRVSYINTKAKKVFGFLDEIIGNKYFLKNFSMSNLQTVAKIKFSVSEDSELTSGDTKDEVEELIVHDNKKELTYKVITVKMLENNEYFGLIKIFHNLTKEKEIDKLKSEFISIAAHQLRTPLSAVKWVVKMILDGDAGKLSKEQFELLEKGYINNERMIKLVNDLLYVSRIEEGRFGYTLKDSDYLAVIKNSISEYEKKCKNKKIKLISNIPDRLPKIKIDTERIDLVLKNIFSNCIKYTPENGVIKLIITREDDYIKTKIIDNGLGIPEKEKKKLFEKFFRASNVVRTQISGSGLGLYITKNIIKRHGGDIKINSKEGKGTEVIFSLPVKKYQNFNI